MIDISKRQRADGNLRESEARFRALAEASPALIWQVDTQGRAVYLNQPYSTWSACRLEAYANRMAVRSPSRGCAWLYRCAGAGGAKAIAACSTACG